MLTEENYCDYDTCVALKELGFSEPTLAYYHGFLPSKPLMYLVIDEDCIPEDGVNVFDLLSNSNKYKDSKNIDAPTLWEAQKWLRKEKKIEVLALSKGMVGAPYDAQVYTEDYVIQQGIEYNSYEEALLEGIKKAVKILEEDGPIEI